MKTIKVICCENKDWLHQIGVWAIEKTEKTTFNHVAVLFIDDDNIEWVYEAVFPRARKILFSKWIKKFKIIKYISLIVDFFIRNVVFLNFLYINKLIVFFHYKTTI
jgi:hypothetical protein